MKLKWIYGIALLLCSNILMAKTYGGYIIRESGTKQNVMIEVPTTKDGSIDYHKFHKAVTFNQQRVGPNKVKEFKFNFEGEDVLFRAVPNTLKLPIDGEPPKSIFLLVKNDGQAKMFLFFHKEEDKIKEMPVFCSPDGKYSMLMEKKYYKFLPSIEFINACPAALKEYKSGSMSNERVPYIIEVFNNNCATKQDSGDQSSN